MAWPGSLLNFAITHHIHVDSIVKLTFIKSLLEVRTCTTLRVAQSYQTGDVRDALL